MRVVRTPEDRFADVPDFAYVPRYADVGGLRVAYVEAGPSDGEPVLLLHGEPSWSFLYRTVMAVLADAGLRVVAEHPDRFARVVAANTGLPTGDQPMPEVWLRFREVVRTAPTLSVSRLVQSGCQTTLSEAVLGAYDAPFPEEIFTAGVRAMPGLVPTSPDDPATQANRAAWRQLSAWDKPFLVAFSDRDPITGAMAPILKNAVPGAAGVQHPVIQGAGHFLQEDAGEQLGAVVADFVRSHPPDS